MTSGRAARFGLVTIAVLGTECRVTGGGDERSARASGGGLSPSAFAGPTADRSSYARARAGQVGETSRRERHLGPLPKGEERQITALVGHSANRVATHCVWASPKPRSENGSIVSFVGNDELHGLTLSPHFHRSRRRIRAPRGVDIRQFNPVSKPPLDPSVRLGGRAASRRAK